MGRRTSVWKAALWGGIAGTIPDLDAFIDHGDALRNMTFHRAESHSLLYLTLFAPVMAYGVAKLHGEMQHLRAWIVAIWLGLFTHPWLDWMTIYGTQLAIPFTNTPYGLGSMFIIDPLYTLPLLIGVGAALAMRSARGLRWNAVGLAVSCAYLAWAAAAQWHVERVARESLAAAGIPAQQVLATPSPFNTILWRIVAMTSTGYVEGFYSLLDAEPRVRFDAFRGGGELADELRGNWGAERMRWFTRGFYKFSEADGTAIVTDLRMGQEPNYVFAFEVAKRGSGLSEITPEAVGGRGNPGEGLTWVWQRLQGRDIPPPR
jgi:inner membrane protein